MMLNLRFALRQLTRYPGFSVVAVLTLALGIGANTAFFSVLNNALFRPLPYPNQTRILHLTETSSNFQDMSVSYPNYLDWFAQQDVFSSLALYMTTGAKMKTADGTERIRLGMVTYQFFDVLGVRPALGRLPQASDDTPAASPVGWLTHTAWQRYFAGEADIVGRSIIIDGRSIPVVGVLPREFRFKEDVDVYVPLAPYAQANFMTMRENHNNDYGIGLLKPGVTLEAARTQMETIAHRLQQQYPKANAGIGIRVEPLRERLAGDSRVELLLLCGAVATVLLIACVNIANMLLARSFTRAREMALRSAIGASRGQLIRQLLLESLLLSGVGGLLGLILGCWGYDLVQRLLPWQMQTFFAESSQIDFRVLGFALVVTLATGVGFGLAPAWQLSAINPADALKNTPRVVHTRFGRFHLRDLLVGVQVALALILVVGASLMIRSLNRLLSVKSGIDPQHVLTLQISPVDPAAFAADPMSVSRFYDRLLSSVTVLPDIESAAISTGIPFSWTYSYSAFYLEGRPVPAPGEFPSASNAMVSDDYFRTMGIPVLMGRTFDGHETQVKIPPGVDITPANLAKLFEGVELVVVINKSFAEKYWPGADPIGKRFRMGYPDMQLPWARVIGVVGDTTHHGLEKGTEPEFYYSVRQFPVPVPPFLVMRTRLAPEAAASSVTATLRNAFPDNPVFDVKTVSDRMDDFVSGRRYNMQLFVFFAGLALLLALIGLYGVLSFVVGQRSREIGIRIALGAGRPQILVDILRRGLLLVVPGIGLGLASGWVAVRLLRSQLYGIAPSDPASYLTSAFLLLVVGAIACYLPALRATRINPVDAIRSE